MAAEKPSDKVSERYETAPGQQAQFDWSTYTVKLGGILTKVIVYSLVLGYSRRKHYWASLDETQASIFEAIEEGFWHFGGTTKELLIDNPKAFVVNPNPQSFQWNHRFLEFCGHYRVQPVACRVGRPRTKGKVERPLTTSKSISLRVESLKALSIFAGSLSVLKAKSSIFWSTGRPKNDLSAVLKENGPL
ncbi:MAG: DDE-type integrase/transposase/recombinase [Candidatus Hadarchaeum sp.]